MVAALTGIASCREADRPAAVLPDRVWPAYRSEGVSGRPSDTVHVRYTVDLSGRADSASLEVLRSTSDVLTSAVRASLARSAFRQGTPAGQADTAHFEERFVFEHDSATAPDSLVATRSVVDLIPEIGLGSAATSPRTMSLAWTDVRNAYQPVLIQLLKTSTLSDSTRGRDATICLGSLFSRGRDAHDTAAAELLRRRGRHVVPVADCRPASGITVQGAPPPRFQPSPGARAPVYIYPELDSWTNDAAWIRAEVIQHHGVDVHVCEARRQAGAWTATCAFTRGYIF